MQVRQGASMKRVEWKAVAAEAGAAAISERLQSVTSLWADARDDYLKLWEAQPTDVMALRRAIRRFEEIDRLRRCLMTKLSSAA
jgi:hypothetical protein